MHRIFRGRSDQDEDRCPQRQVPRGFDEPFRVEVEIGMLNLIDGGYAGQLSTAPTPARSSTSPSIISSACRAGSPPTIPAFQIWMTHTPHGEELADVMKVGLDHNKLVSYSGDAITMYTHCGTHVDALNHFGYHGRVFNNYSSAEHLGSRHWDVNGAGQAPANHRSSKFLLDIAAMHGQNMLPNQLWHRP